MSQRALQVVILAFTLLLHAHAGAGSKQAAQTHKIIDTGVDAFYDNTSVITKPKQGDPFFGQDAQYQINAPSCTDNGMGPSQIM
jgi:hypothetical protein